MVPTVADRRAAGSSGPLALYGLPGPQLHEGLTRLAVDLEEGAEILAAHQPWPRVRTPAAIALEGPAISNARVAWLSSCGWVARWSATGCGPGRGPGRWPCMPPGRPTPRPRSRSCWPRPVGPAPQSPYAAPAPWLEPAELAHRPDKGLVVRATRGSGQARLASNAAAPAPRSAQTH